MEILHTDIIGRATISELRVSHPELGEFSLTITVRTDLMEDCIDVVWDADKNFTPEQWEVLNDWVNTVEWDK